jgi:general secretion pathway protein D
MNMRLDSSGNLTEGTRTGSVFGTPGFDNGGRGGIFQIAESQFSMTIRALQATGKLDVLSRPYILASDNQLASINIGQQVPYVTGSVTDAQGGVTNSVNYAQVGVLLDVIPHINPDGMVILDVAPEVSALLDSRIQISTDVSAPVFSTRSAQTRVAVENGQTVVIGGLMQDQKQSTVSKVPILGDIPWIGPLFQSRHENKSKTELLIFLTPHVAQRPDVLQGMADDELNHAKLAPNAVSPGTFQEHMQGMKAAAPPPTTRPVSAEPE